MILLLYFSIMDDKKILELHSLALKSVEIYQKHRYAYAALSKLNARPFIGIVGARGAGKTVLLRQCASGKPEALYISADTLDDRESLFDIIKLFHEKYRLMTFFIDEIYYFKNFSGELKKIYDFLPVSIFFTSSVSLSLYNLAKDISRRVMLQFLPPFSLREYAYFKKDADIPPLSFSDILNNNIKSIHLTQSGIFDDYLKAGLFPFCLNEENPFPLFENILKKIIYGDIPGIQPHLEMEELDIIRKVVAFIGKSPVEGINHSSVSRNIGITNYKAAEYCNLLEMAFIIRQIFPAGASVLKEPKILMQLPYRLLYRTYEECIGEIREDFFALAMSMHNMDFSYLKTTRGKKTPDFLIYDKEAPVVIEIGGAGKGRTQFKDVDYSRKLIFYHTLNEEGMKNVSKDRYPLYLLGYPGG